MNFDPVTYNEVQQLRAHFALLNGSPEALNVLLAATVTPASFAAWLAGAGKRALFDQLLGTPAGMRAVAASSTAMTAILASSAAMTAMVASSTAMAAVAASSTAMTAVWADNAVADAVLTSPNAKLAVYGSDSALERLQANPTQVTRQIGIAGRTLNASASVSAFVFVPNGTKVILLRRYYSSAEHDAIGWARNSGMSAVGLGPAGGGRNLDSGTWANGCVSGSYTSSGTAPSTNDTVSNFVSAANGLQRRAWMGSQVLYVVYIIV